MVAKGRLNTDDGLKAAKEANEPQQPTSGECFRNNENDRKRLKNNGSYGQELSWINVCTRGRITVRPIKTHEKVLIKTVIISKLV